MSKNLKAIQILSKIGKILSKIVWICCIVAAIGSVIGIISLALGAGDVLKIGGVTIHNIIETEAGDTLNNVYAALAVAFIYSVCDGVVAWFAERYFTNELKAGTPFTVPGAGELLRLGILTAAVPLGGTILAAIVHTVMENILPGIEEMHFAELSSVALGITFIVVSVIFRYGAECLDQKENPYAEN